MKKFYLFVSFAWVFLSASTAQTVTPQYINFTLLAEYEAAHPENFQECRTCPKEESDAGWKDLNPDLVIPRGAIIKKQLERPATPATPTTPLNPTNPLTPSPAPNQNFLGYVDPGDGIPPDTHGAVGPNHVVTATNDFLVIHSKNGTVISSVTITSFAGVPNSCDPYIKYDPQSNRWFYSAIDCSGNNGNRVAVLVSQSSDPTGGWFRYTFTPNVPSGTFFLDHPYLGFDNRWVVISGRKFPTGGNFAGPVLFLLDKTRLVNSQGLTFGVDAQAIEKTAADGDAPLPVTVYGNNPSPGTFYILQNWNGASGAIRLSTVTGNIPNAVWNSSSPGAVFPTTTQTWNSSTGSVAEQLGETRRVATNDARISTGVMVNGNIWCAHHVGVTANNVAVQWWQLNGTPGASFGSVIQRGRIGAGIANNYRYFPAIAVNENEDVMIGYTVSSNTSRISCAYSFRSNTTAPNTTDEENIYKLGISTYYKDFGGARARWGDYSHSALDPTDGSLWTIQEYAAQRVGATDDDSRYGVWWAQVVPASSLLSRDASIGSIVEPVPGLLCKIPVVPTVTIRNIGVDTLKSVQIGMLLDNVPYGQLVTINNLAVPTFGLSQPITLGPSFTPLTGPHTLKFYTKNPNGGTDQRPSNDTSSVIFTLAPELALPYTENFTAGTFPPNNGSAVINADGPAGLTWARSTLAGRPGPASMRISCYTYEEIGERDIYRTPKINTSILDSLVVTFNVAYRQYFGTDVPSAPNDSLRVIYSPDCGVSWYPTDYAKGGATLSTVPGTTGANFTPANASQWRTERVVLKNLCERDLQNVMIGFEAYNDFGNTMYVDSINIVGFNSSARNAILKSISKPLPALCTTDYTPEITFANAGLDTIKTLKINYKVDNGVAATIDWSGNLAKCDEVTLSLPASSATVGTHVLTVYTSDPNDTTDLVPGNDTLTSTFSIFAPATTPLFEGFESNNFPRENWGVQNVNGGTTFERSTATAKTGLASMRINNPDNRNFNGAIDYLVSPIVLNSVDFDSVFVDFDVSYKSGQQYPGSTVFPLDTLELLATDDCGKTFTSVWKKWGDELQTINDPNYAYSIPFTPSLNNQWKKKRIYLTPFVGSENFQLYFAMKGNKQNNLWIDNINITSQTLPQRLKDQGYLVYPNPFNNSFLIHHSAVEPPVDLKSAQVFNSAGQLMWERQYNGNAERQITVDLKNVAKGVYILKMIYTGKTVVERIVKN
jgi:hypothetical protein